VPETWDSSGNSGNSSNSRDSSHSRGSTEVNGCEGISNCRIGSSTSRQLEYQGRPTKEGMLEPVETLVAEGMLATVGALAIEGMPATSETTTIVMKTDGSMNKGNKRNRVYSNSKGRSNITGLQQHQQGR
jgi:hypothetical protein